MKNFKKTNIGNYTCYYFDAINKNEDFDFDNTLLDEKSYKNILIYDISNKTLIGAKPFCIRFYIVDVFIGVYSRPTIISTVFWDFLMFYQIFLSPQVKQCAIITYKHGTYEFIER